MSPPRRVCGEGNGTPLQYSCLENPMDRGAWEAAVHGRSGLPFGPRSQASLQKAQGEDNLRDLQGNIKHYNIQIIGVPEEEDKKKDH